MKRVILGLMAVALFGCAAYAQQNAKPETNPVSNALRTLVERESSITVAAVEEMPADKFSFRPTPQQITFGHLVAHMGEANYRFCSMISGAQMPKMESVKDTDPKDTLVAALKSSFAFCAQSLAKLDDSNLGEQVPFFGGRLASRGAVVLTLAQDYGDHYSMASVYLRLNGLLPPTARRRK
ncbi:MAG TPA: DinB family protein [Candidatus Polarisedimenticolia bacterium]|nr:DinB family protein [Candidatus Polarisedimenticolia bacterium]